MTDREKRELTLGERAVNWAKVLGILLPLIGAATVSVLGWFKSDNAQSGVDSLVLQLSDRVAKQEKVINAQSEKLEKMVRRMVFFQGHQAGVEAGKLYERNQQLEKQLSELTTPKRKKRVVSRPVEPDPEPIADAYPPAPPSRPDRPRSKLAPRTTFPEQTKIPRIYSKPFVRKK